MADPNVFLAASAISRRRKNEFRRAVVRCVRILRVRALYIVLVSFVAALAIPSTALAHANLLRSNPADGAVVKSPPRALRLVFDDPVRVEPGIKAVRNDGTSVLAGRPRVVGQREMLVPLQAHLPDGDYTILWRALTDDGHSIAGVIAFAVGAGRAPPHAALTAPSGQPPLQIIARWLFLAGILTASGAALSALALRRAAEPPSELFVAAFLLVIAGALLLLQGQASFATRFGRVIVVAAVIATLGAAAAGAAARHRRPSPGAWLAALLILPAPSLSGHALDPGRSPLEFPVDLLHVTASSVWLGGLLTLALHLRRGGASAELLRRFSTLAVGTVVVLAATGIARALDELSAVEQLWNTGYGRLLVVKSVLLGLLVGLGWMNRLQIHRGRARWLPRLRRNLAAELAIFVVVLIAVAVLTQSRPGRDRLLAAAARAGSAAGPRGRSSPAADVLVLAQRGGALQLSGLADWAASPDGRSVFWHALGAEEGDPANLVERDLETRRTRVVARGIAPQQGVAVTSDWIVYGTATVPGQVVAVSRVGGLRRVLARGLVAPLARRGDRVAWAEQDGERQRVVVREMKHGTDWVAADLPKCDHGRCYRIDAVTLADDGVAFDRGGAAGASYVVRRAYSGARIETTPLSGDPQPDLIPSSEGAAYYRVGHGWYRWDFGQARPRRAGFASGSSAQPMAFESNRWILRKRRPCGDEAFAQGPDGRRVVIGSPEAVRAMAGVKAAFCPSLLRVSVNDGRPVMTWAVVPPDSHGTDGATGVIVVGERFRPRSP